MKLIQSYKIPAVLLILILGFVFATETGSISSGAGEYSILSILPPLFAILLALVTHEAHLSLFIGIWLGSTLVAGVGCHGCCTGIWYGCQLATLCGVRCPEFGTQG